VCCGTGSPSSAFCKNLGTDSANCGGCGITCPSGQCRAVSNYSGQCNCSFSSCPLGQRCQPNQNVCQCRNTSECASSETCLSSSCRY
jgi:hypothetical protein